MAYLSTEGKTGYKMTLYISKMNRYFFQFLSAIRKFPLKNVMQNWK